MLANRFRSGRVPHQHIGISSFTENKLVLDVIGNANITNDLTVGGELNAPSIIVSGSAPAQFDDVTARNLQISGIATFLGNVSIAGTLTYEDVTNIDSLGIITARSGLDIQSGTVSIGGSTGNDAQYLRSTGIGVTWSDFPTLRTEQRFITTAGQTSFSYQYNPGFLDVFYNGVKLSPGAEYTATNGTQVVLLSPAFEGDILELIAYNTVTTGGGGSGGAGGGGSTRVSVGNTAPQNASSGDLWWKSNEGQLKIYYSDEDSSQWVDAAAGGGGGGGGSISYTLPPASDTTLGGIIVGTGLTVTNTGILSTTGNNSGGGGGSSTLEGLTDTTLSSPQTGQVLKYQAGTGWINDASGAGLSDIISDTTPQLGGDLDVNGKRFVTTANSHILFQPNGTGKIGIGNVSVPYSLFHVRGSYPRITVEKTGAFEESGIDFRDNNGVIGAAISHVSDGNNLVLNVLSSERLRVTESGLKVTGITTINGNTDINGDLDVSGSIDGVSHLSYSHSATTETLIVKVVDKTNAHRFLGDGSAKGYTLDGVESPFLSLTPGRKYRFDQSDASNTTHQLKFYLDVDKQFLFEDNVTYNDTAGNVGAYTEITVTDHTPSTLYYQCVNHPKMGNSTQLNTNHIDTNFDASLRRGLSVSGLSTFSGTIDAQGIVQALTFVSESTPVNSVFYAGNGGQLVGGSNVTYNGTTFQVSGKNFTVSNGHSQLNTVNVSGMSTVVGVGTFKDNVYIDNDCFVGNELWVKGIKVTSGDENDPPSFGEDINTRNLRVTGISTFVGLSSFTSGLEVNSSNVFLSGNQSIYFGGTPKSQGGNGSDAKLSINGNTDGNAYVAAGDGGVYLRTKEFFIQDKSNVGIVTVRETGVTVAGIVTANSFDGDGTNLTLGSINTLSDVDASTPTNGHVLKWNGSAQKWQAAADQTAGSGSGIALGDLSVTSSPAGTNSLTYNDASGVFTHVPYLLPAATATDLGGIKIGTGLSIDGNGVVSSNTAGNLGDLSNVTVTSATAGDIVKWNGTSWVNEQLSESIGISRYASPSAFPATATNEGQLAYANNNNSLYLSNGSGWTGQRVVTTNNTSSSDLTTILGTIEKVYDVSTADYVGGSGSYNTSRKSIRLSDNGSTPTVTEFVLHAGTGLSISKSTNAESKDEIGLSVNSGSFSLSAETSTGPADSTLRLSDNLASTNTDIKFAGSNIVISRTDSNTLLFSVPDFPEEYSDNKAKDALGTMLQGNNSAHTNISFAYNSTSKIITATASGSGSSTDTKYDLSGSSTTSNSAKINLVPEAGGDDSVTNTIEIVGGVRTTNLSSGTTVDWDNPNGKITISSPAVNIPDWNVNGGTTANPTGSAGGILNKPSLSDIGQTGKLADSNDLKNASPNDNDRLKYVSSTQKWTPTSNNLADLSNVSSAIPSDGQVLKWDDTNSVWKPDTDESGASGSTAFKGLSDTPNDYTGYAGKFLKVNSAENALEYTDAAGASTIEELPVTSSSIAAGADGNVDITNGYKVYTLFKIKTSVASWVRVYCDAAKRTDDASRSLGNDPLPGSGVIAEVLTSTANEEVLITPGIMGFNNDNPRANKIYLAINNRTGSATAVTVTLTVLKIGE